MEVHHGKLQKKTSIFKKLERYVSINRSTKSSTNMFTKSKSLHRTTSKASNNDNRPMRKRQVAPSGCFSVYVGPEKQRFVIKTEFSSHSLFKMLLEDAELEYGFNSDSPLLIPCEVDLFVKVLAEMDSTKEFDNYRPTGCSSDYSCSPFSPARFWDRSGSYVLLTPPRLLKINEH